MNYPVVDHPGERNVAEGGALGVLSCPDFIWNVLEKCEAKAKET